MADLTVVKALEPQINAEHMKAMEGAKSYMEHAMKAGDLLANAKKILPHGAFQNWITDNLAFTVRTAQNYMRAAAHRKELASANVEQYRMHIQHSPNQSPYEMYQKSRQRTMKLKYLLPQFRPRTKQTIASTGTGER
jgi:hypothetical protein